MARSSHAHSLLRSLERRLERAPVDFYPPNQEENSIDGGACLVYYAQLARNSGEPGPATSRAEEAAEKGSNAVILSPFAVILSAANDLALPLRVNYAKNPALLAQGKLREGSRSERFKAVRDSSSLLLLRMTGL